jgi:hypothetical protein
MLFQIIALYCTAFYFLQYTNLAILFMLTSNKKARNKTDLSVTLNPEYEYKENCKGSISPCNISLLLSKCNLFRFKTLKKILPEYQFNIFYSAQLEVERVLNQGLPDAIYTYLFPLIGCVGFFLNMLSVLVLRNKKNAKDLKARVYKFMLLDSVLSCFICLLSICQFSVKCSTSSGRFCVDTEQSDCSIRFLDCVQLYAEWAQDGLEFCSSLHFHRQIHALH